MLKFKAFIYRFSNIFGLHIYLAKKEQREFMNSQVFTCDLTRSIAVGTWQAKNGFTTVWTYKQNFFESFISKTKHALRIK
jgi:hypothetical protein